jgi:hypothetical protein
VPVCDSRDKVRFNPKENIKKIYPFPVVSIMDERLGIYLTEGWGQGF